MMKGDTEVKYCDVVSGDVGMTMMVMLGGRSKPRFEIPIVVVGKWVCASAIANSVTQTQKDRPKLSSVQELGTSGP